MQSTSPGKQLKSIAGVMLVMLLVAAIAIGGIYLATNRSDASTGMGLWKIVSGPTFVAGNPPECTGFDRNFDNGVVPNYDMVFGLVQPTISGGKLVVQENTVLNDYDYLQQVDFTLETEISNLVVDPALPAEQTTGAGLGVYNPTLSYVGVGFGTNSSGAKEIEFVMATIAQPDNAPIVYTLPNNATTVKIKLTRSGPSFSAYYAVNGGAYVLLGTKESNANVETWGYYPSISTGNLVTASFDNYKLTCGSVSSNDPNVKSPVYRFWSDQKQRHFYTISSDERDYVISNYSDYVWKYEGIAYFAYPASGETCTGGRSPVYRFWSDQNQGHFYTISSDEKSYVQANYPAKVWSYERVAYCADTTTVTGAVALHRFWSDQKQGHFYTASEDEKTYVVNNYDDFVWKYERTAYYVYTN